MLKCHTASISRCQLGTGVLALGNNVLIRLIRELSLLFSANTC
uniref:Uncharacterized protein n=1 Tax=Anguilla anguilla TaxID=7936 RepID=A0A0E9TQC4_ANGAN